ncbi:methyltransferase family protein [Thauera linaloolentis]|uniref:O-methyltransferase family protein n=1 Tax=Thauera linaloolentis (strain DSM 12138 / JCM 21573 / CCUG 41526 / CIP 105981 / IAM 15112 / NBRC 102519 / 47Lol) TaxID=1123367 RepID=N6XZU7_THAL4|nr:hypothetical protein [Thauera linaloolentis]ENO84790.1 O-methyltransferase family protein [Thauera linaloolentis 47Lol = DSM 12138]MCM8564977.1 hypothetical protein [Thauera linaloolentis]
MDTQAHAPAALDLSNLAPPPAAATLRGIADGFKAFQILRAGFASGLFDWLGDNGPAEKSAIAAATGLRGAHLGGFLQALEDLGLLACHEHRYALAPGMEAVLCASSPWHQAQAIDGLLAPANGWSDLARFLSDAWQPVAAVVPPPAQHPLLGDACHLARHLAARHGVEAPARLLCIDGGDGLLAAALAGHFPDTDITVAVAPSTLARTQQTLGASPSGNRCRVVTGSPLEPPADVFDQVVVFHALYPVRRAMSDALAALAATLAPGGELVLAHWFCLEACETAPGGLRELDKAVLTDSHPLCHVEGFCTRLENAGLSSAERADLESDYGVTKLHFARCPER